MAAIYTLATELSLVSAAAADDDDGYDVTDDATVMTSL